MDSKDLEAGVEAAVLLPDTKVDDGTRQPAGPHAGAATPATDGSLSDRLETFRGDIQARAVAKYNETYPKVLDTLRRAGKLCGLVLMLIFVIMLASWFIALSHWFTVVFGHIVLHYTFPTSIDDAFDQARLDSTMIFAAIGAFVVNLPPLVIFLLSFPLTFDRTVLEGSAAPANEFIKRITPKNRYALLFMKYAPRLLAGPIGCAIFWLLEGDNQYDNIALDPLHATIAGIAGEVVLSGLGLLKNRFLGKGAKAEATDAGKGGEVLPTSVAP